MYLLKSVRHRLKETVVTTAVLAISVSALLLVVSLSTSIEGSLGQKIERSLCPDAILYPNGDDETMTELDTVLEAVRGVDGVRECTPRLRVQALMTPNTLSGGVRGGVIFGVDPEGEERTTGVPDIVTRGDYALFKERSISGYPPILIGSSLREGLNASIYAEGTPTSEQLVRVTAGEYSGSHENLTPLVMQFVVVGEFVSDIPLFDGVTAFVPIQDARWLSNQVSTSQVANQVLVKTSEGSDNGRVLRDAVAAVRDATGQELSGKTDSEYIDDYLKPVFDTVRPITYLIIVVSTSAMLLRVWHTAVVSMWERRREVGMLRAIGIGKWSLTWFYLTEHLLIGVASVLVGMSISYLISIWLMNSGWHLWTLPVSSLDLFPPASVLGPLALAIALIMGLTPLVAVRRAASGPIVRLLGH